MYTEISCCRLCGSTGLKGILNLGELALTGVFPKNTTDYVPTGPLALCLCDSCQLVQLQHSYDMGQLYGDHYGYRSGLNQSMVTHLREKVASLSCFVSLRDDDIVVDIGSNDGTTLGFYPEHVQRVGFDPSALKFQKYYKPNIELILDFFSADQFKKHFGKKKARIITSIAMFYDLEDPQEFMHQVASLLAPDGIWHFEQSYMPAMLKANAYDTVCHEHLEYYALEQIKFMTDKAGLKILDVTFNDVNGGSFAVTAALAGSPQPEASELVQIILNQEEALGLHTLTPYITFSENTRRHKDNLIRRLQVLRSEGKVVFGYGASTKGNVILQYCGLTEKDIPCIAEVNENKFGCYTPGSHIPIVSEAEAKASNPDVFLVLPWHFKDNLIAREKDFLHQGGKMFFPLPEFSLIG